MMTGTVLALRLAQLTIEDHTRRSVLGSGAVQTDQIRRGPGRGHLTVLVESVDLLVATQVAARVRSAYSQTSHATPIDDLADAIHAGIAAPANGPVGGMEHYGEAIEGAVAVLFRDGILHFALTGTARMFRLRDGRVSPLGLLDPEHDLGDQVIAVGQYEVAAGDTIVLLGRACHPNLIHRLPENQEEYGHAAGLLQVFHDNRRAFPPDITIATLTAEETQAPLPPDPRQRARRPRPAPEPEAGPEEEDANFDQPDSVEPPLERFWEIWRGHPIAVAAVVVAVALGIIAFIAFREMSTTCRVGQLLFVAEAREAEAARAADPAAKHRLLTTAAQPASQAIICDPNDYGAASARKRIQDQLNALDNAVTSPWAATHALVSGDIRQVIMQAETLYLLDSADGSVFFRTLSGRSLASASPDRVLVRRQDRAGALEASDPVAIAWLPAGGSRESDGLAILDRNGLLFEHEPGQRLAVTSMRAGANWAKVMSFGGYAGALFVLDPQSRDILWYPATPAGYTGQPYRYIDPLATVDLATAQQILVGEDILALLAGGEVKRLHRGREIPFELITPEGQITKASRLYARDKSIFVAEAKAHRIVQFDWDGKFMQQWRYDAAEDLFSGFRDFAVDRATKRVVIVNQRGVYLAEWPDKG